MKSNGPWKTTMVLVPWLYHIETCLRGMITLRTGFLHIWTQNHIHIQRRRLKFNCTIMYIYMPQIPHTWSGYRVHGSFPFCERPPSMENCFLGPLQKNPPPLGKEMSTKTWQPIRVRIQYTNILWDVTMEAATLGFPFGPLLNRSQLSFSHIAKGPWNKSFV